MNYQGDILLGDPIDVKFTTVSTTGVPTTLAGTPAVSAYVDNNTTEITAGITLSVDFDARTGLHNVRVMASAGNGFATGTNVNLVITAGTVGGNSVVGYVIGSFSIEKRSAARPGAAMTLTSVYDPAKTAASPAQVNIEADAALSDVGLTTTVTGRIDSAVSTRASQTSLDAVDDFVDTEISAIKAKTDQFVFASGDVKATLDFETVTVAVNNDKAGYSLTSAYDASKTAAQPGAAMTLTPPYDPAKTAMQAGTAVTLTAAYDAAKTAASQASLNVTDADVEAIKVVTDRLDTMLEADGAVYRYTANALEQAPAGGGGTGGTDWTSLERDQIRHRLGIDGAAVVPATGTPSLATQASVNLIDLVTDKLNTTLEADGSVFRFTANALEQAPVGTGGNGGSPAPADSPCFENPARTTGPTTEPPAFAHAIQRVRVWGPPR